MTKVVKVPRFSNAVLRLRSKLDRDFDRGLDQALIKD